MVRSLRITAIGRVRRPSHNSAPASTIFQRRLGVPKYPGGPRDFLWADRAPLSGEDHSAGAPENVGDPPPICSSDDNDSGNVEATALPGQGSARAHHAIGLDPDLHRVGDSATPLDFEEPLLASGSCSPPPLPPPTTADTLATTLPSRAIPVRSCESSFSVVPRFHETASPERRRPRLAASHTAIVGYNSAYSNSSTSRQSAAAWFL